MVSKINGHRVTNHFICIVQRLVLKDKVIRKCLDTGTFASRKPTVKVKTIWIELENIFFTFIIFGALG